MMEYYVSETLGEATITKEYKGTPEEIYEILKYEEKIKAFGWNEPKPLKSSDYFANTNIHVEGNDVAKKVKEQMKKAWQELLEQSK